MGKFLFLILSYKIHLFDAHTNFLLICLSLVQGKMQKTKRFRCDSVGLEKKILTEPTRLVPTQKQIQIMFNSSDLNYSLEK